MPKTPREVFLTLVNGVADNKFDGLPELYAEITDVRHPMAWPPAEPLLTRESLRGHFTVPPGVTPPRRQVVDVVVHETADPEVIVAEFGYEFEHDDGRTTTVPCVFVMRVRDGRIIESRDYIDRIRSAMARDAIDQLCAALRPATE